MAVPVTAARVPGVRGQAPVAGFRIAWALLALAGAGAVAVSAAALDRHGSAREGPRPTVAAVAERVERLYAARHRPTRVSVEPRPLLVAGRPLELSGHPAATAGARTFALCGDGPSCSLPSRRYGSRRTLLREQAFELARGAIRDAGLHRVVVVLPGPAGRPPPEVVVYSQTAAAPSVIPVAFRWESDRAALVPARRRGARSTGG